MFKISISNKSFKKIPLNKNGGGGVGNVSCLHINMTQPNLYNIDQIKNANCASNQHIRTMYEGSTQKTGITMLRIQLCITGIHLIYSNRKLLKKLYNILQYCCFYCLKVLIK